MKSRKSQDIVSNPRILLEHFKVIEDPRIERHRCYPLQNILFFAFISILSDQQSWYQIVEFCEDNLDWFSEYIDVKQGVPSHDTFRRVFGLLEPQVLSKTLASWTEELRKDHGSETRLVAIDGKAIRGVPWRGSEEELYTLNAFESGSGLCLGQVEVDTKSNEINAMPTLLSMINLSRSVVSTDALLTQKKIAKEIREKGGDYLLALKKNHRNFLEEAELYFSELHEGQCSWRTLEKNRGYVEERTISVSGNTEGWETLKEWAGLQHIIKIQSRRTRDGQTREETRYYVTSWSASASAYLDGVRKHWGIENGLHRTLDVIFREDAALEHERTTAANLSVMRKMALSLLKQLFPDKTLVSKRKKAAYSPKFRTQLLMGLI